MRARKRPFLFLLLGIFSLGVFLFLLFTSQPQTILFYKPLFSFFGIHFFALSSTVLLLLFLFLSLFSLIGFLTKNARRGFLAGLFVISFLLLRLFHITHFFFAIILLLLFISLDVVFARNS